jgi:hypothetical protein
VLKGGLVEPFVELKVKKPWIENFIISSNMFNSLLEPRELLLQNYIRVS